MSSNSQVSIQSPFLDPFQSLTYSQKFALEKATSELEIQISSQMEDYVTQMTAVNLRFKQLDDVSDLIQ